MTTKILYFSHTLIDLAGTSTGSAVTSGRGILFATSPTLPTSGTAGQFVQGALPAFQWVIPIGSVWADHQVSNVYSGIEHVVSGTTAGSQPPTGLAFPEGTSGFYAVPTINGTEFTLHGVFIPLGFEDDEPDRARRMSLGRGATPGSERYIKVVYDDEADGQLTIRRIRLQYVSTTLPANTVINFYYDGSAGPRGLRGARGERGEQGIQGIQGEAGKDGVNGVGIQGPRGATGATGAMGLRGQRGLQGIQGIKGDKGDDGDSIVGPQGAQGNPGADSTVPGPQGLRGLQGETGPQGAMGLRGLQGIQGLKGDKGDTGDTGPQGIQGIQGIRGPAGVGSASDFTDLNDTPSDYTGDGGKYVAVNPGATGLTFADPPANGATGPRGQQGIQGERGEQGIQGETGPQGTQGVPGETGPQGTQGVPGERGPAGTATVTATAVRRVLGLTETENDNMLVDAVVNGNTLELTKNDGDTVDVPLGGGSGGGSTDWEDLTNFDDLDVVGTSDIATDHLPIVDNTGDVNRVSTGALTAYIQGDLESDGYLIPDGGTTGQVLAKSSNTDQATQWVDQTGNPLTTEQVQDIVGAMFTGNTETNIVSTYDDATGKINLHASGGGSTPPPATATFYMATPTSRTVNAATFTGSTLPTYTGALPATFTVPANTFNNLRYMAYWVPNTHPITNISEDSTHFNQFGAFSNTPLTVNSVAGTAYVSNRLIITNSDSEIWRLS